MNERIDQLARAAGFKHPDHVGLCEEYAYFDHVKFAELIVQECCEVVKWTPSQFPNDEYVKNIKEHFGVEE